MVAPAGRCRGGRQSHRRSQPTPRAHLHTGQHNQQLQRKVRQLKQHGGALGAPLLLPLQVAQGKTEGEARRKLVGSCQRQQDNGQSVAGPLTRAGRARVRWSPRGGCSRGAALRRSNSALSMCLARWAGVGPPRSAAPASTPPPGSSSRAPAARRCSQSSHVSPPPRLCRQWQGEARGSESRTGHAPMHAAEAPEPAARPRKAACWGRLHTRLRHALGGAPPTEPLTRQQATQP